MFFKHCYHEILISISRLIYRIIFIIRQNLQNYLRRVRIYTTIFIVHYRSHCGIMLDKRKKRRFVSMYSIHILLLFHISILRIGQNRRVNFAPFFPSRVFSFKALYSLLKFHLTKILSFDSDRQMNIFFKVLTTINGMRRLYLYN